MKILYLNHNYKGEATYKRCFFMARELAKKGHHLTIITVSNRFPDYSVRLEREDSVDIITLPAHSRHRDYLYYGLRPFINIPVSFFSNYDILHSFTVAEPVVAFPTIFNKFKMRPLVIDWDDCYGRGGYASGKPVRFIMEPLMTILEERVLRLGERITVVSEALRERALQLGINCAKIYKIVNGADFDFIKPLDKIKCRRAIKFPEDKKIILNMERHNTLTPRLLDIFQKVLVNNSEVILICLGEVNKKKFDFSCRQKLAQLIEERKLVLVGARPYRELPLYLSAADVLILFMEDNVVERSRSPLRLGDYLSSGRPIVATNIGEVGYILKKYNCGLIAETEDEFINNINTVLRDASISVNYGNTARKLAEGELSWENIAQKMLEVYKGL